jgi:hypothetical protein
VVGPARRAATGRDDATSAWTCRIDLEWRSIRRPRSCRCWAKERLAIRCLRVSRTAGVALFAAVVVVVVVVVVEDWAGSLAAAGSTIPRAAAASFPLTDTAAADDDDDGAWPSCCFVPPAAMPPPLPPASDDDDDHDDDDDGSGGGSGGGGGDGIRKWRRRRRSESICGGVGRWPSLLTPVPFCRAETVVELGWRWRGSHTTDFPPLCRIVTVPVYRTL